MKTNNRLIISLFLVLLVFGVNVAKGQIQNRIIRPENARMNGVEIDRAKALSGRVLPKVDVEQLLREDSLEKSKGRPFRFGKDSFRKCWKKRELGNRFSGGFHLFITIISRWRNDEVFDGDAWTFSQPDFSLGSVITIAYRLKKQHS